MDNRVFTLALLTVALLVCFGLLAGCGDESDSSDNDYALLPQWVVEDEIDADAETAAGMANLETFEEAELIEVFTPPQNAAGDPFSPDENPAIGYGPYTVEVRKMHIDDANWFRTAYFFVPKTEGKGGAYATIVWGHGIWASNWPMSQREMFLRQASRGFVVVYPNMDVPFPYPRETTVAKAVGTYLRAIRRALWLGLADPDRIIFGGYSFGSRVAALATIRTTGADPNDRWPNPVACVYDALPDYAPTRDRIIPLHGPLPSDWAYLIDPSIPQTIMAAEDDTVVPLAARDTGEALNGQVFFNALETDFAQLIVLKSGTTWLDTARHSSFRAGAEPVLDSFDLWGHMKILAGVAMFHFESLGYQWGYGFMRSVGGTDRAGNPLVHEIQERGAVPRR